MTTTVEPTVQWTQDQMLEVVLNEPDDFLKVRETLTRIGVASRKEKKLYQSCHILHKQGKYFIVHFKELFALDGKHANLTINDVQRRNRITRLLADWGLISIVKEDDFNKVIKEVVNKVNKNLSVIEQVRKFILIDHEFTIENSMMTPSMKVRRFVVKDKYGDQLEKLY